MSIIIPGQSEAQQVQLPGQPFLKGQDQEVIKERHDINATHEAIQQMLAGGTPDWFKWPHDYKNFVKESFAAEKEISNKMASQYKWDDQEDLTNEAARKVNKIVTRDFIEKKLKVNGIKATIFDNGWIGPGGVPTVALFCTPPNRTNKLRPICYLDVPYMWEWSVLLLDAHGIPNGEKSRGWRTVAVQLVEKEIITEAQCHKIFGVPSPNAISARYFRSLWEKRNGKRYRDIEDQEALGQSA
jgi:hypothetical protein